MRSPWTLVHVGAKSASRLPRVDARQARPRQWRDILAASLAQHEAVRGTVISYLRRTPTRAEITAARRAAHRLAANGQASILRVKPAAFDGPGSPHLILVRPGTTPQGVLLDELSTANVSERTRLRFEPMVMAQDLATSVELLAAAIQAVPAISSANLNASGWSRLSTHPLRPCDRSGVN
jgi:hypothetical protein